MEEEETTGEEGKRGAERPTIGGKRAPKLFAEESERVRRRSAGEHNVKISPVRVLEVGCGRHSHSVARLSLH